LKDKFYSFFGTISEYGLYGVLFFLAISNALVESFLGLMFLGFIGRKILKPDFRFLKFWPNILLLAFLCFSALSLFNSGELLNISLRTLFGKWARYLAICIIVQDTIYSEKTVRHGILVFLFGAALAVLSGLSQYFLGIEFLRGSSIYIADGGIRAISSSFVHYNSYAGYLVVVLPLILGFLLENDFRGLKAAGLSVFSLLAVFTFVLTFSRGGWLALTCAFIFMAFVSRKHLIRLLPILCLVAIFLFFYPPVQERVLFSFSTTGDNNRFRYWTTALQMIKAHPLLGIGLGTFMGKFSEYSSVLLSPAYAHNCYLQIWAETGMFSFFSFIGFVGAIVYLGIRKLFDSRNSLLLGLLSGVVGFLVQSFFEVNLYSLRLAVLFWIWVGLVSACVYRKQEEI